MRRAALVVGLALAITGPCRAGETPGEQDSILSLPISFKVGRLRALLEKNVATSVDHLKDWYKVPGTDYGARYAWERGPFGVDMSGATLSLTSRFGYKARFGMHKRRPWPFNKKRIWMPLVSTGMGEPLRRVDVRLASALAFGEDWRLHSKTRIESKLLDPVRVTFLNIDASRFVNAWMKHELEAAAAKVDRKIPELVDLRERMSRAWTRMQRPLAVPRAGNAWVLLDPRGLGVSPFLRDGERISFTLQVRARPRVVLGQMPKVEAVALPALGTSPKGEGFRLGLTAALPHAKLGETLQAAFRRASIRSPLGRLGIGGFRVSGEGERLLVDLDLTGALSGTLRLAGRPVSDPSSGTISVPDLDYELRDASWISPLKSWLEQGWLRDRLRGAARFPLTGALGTLKKAAARLFEKGLGQGTALTGAVGAVEVPYLRSVGDRLEAQLVISGKVNLELE